MVQSKGGTCLFSQKSQLRTMDKNHEELWFYLTETLHKDYKKLSSLRNTAQSKQRHSAIDISQWFIQSFKKLHKLSEVSMREYVSINIKRKKNLPDIWSHFSNAFQKIELEKPFNEIITDKRINYKWSFFRKERRCSLLKMSKYKIYPPKLRLRSSNISLLLELEHSVFRCSNYSRKSHNLLSSLQIFIVIESSYSNFILFNLFCLCVPLEWLKNFVIQT